MKDVMGNDLHVGDLVMIQLDRPIVFGRIVEASEGGLVTGLNHKGGAEVRPGRILISAIHTVDFDPRVPIRTVAALRDQAIQVEHPAKSSDELQALN